MTLHTALLLRKDIGSSGLRLGLGQSGNTVSFCKWLDLHCARGEMDDRLEEQQLSAPGSMYQVCWSACYGMKMDRSADPAS